MGGKGERDQHAGRTRQENHGGNKSAARTPHLPRRPRMRTTTQTRNGSPNTYTRHLHMRAPTPPPLAPTPPPPAHAQNQLLALHPRALLLRLGSFQRFGPTHTHAAQETYARVKRRPPSPLLTSAGNGSLPLSRRTPTAKRPSARREGGKLRSSAPSHTAPLLDR